jgi:hypothetical protein
MEGIDHLKRLIREIEWLVKLDLQDAYFVVSLHLNIKSSCIFSGREYCTNTFVFRLAYLWPPVFSQKF